MIVATVFVSTGTVNFFMVIIHLGILSIFCFHICINTLYMILLNTSIDVHVVHVANISHALSYT